MPLERIDEERIRTIAQMMKEMPKIEILRFLLPKSPDTILGELERKLDLLHGGLLVFPSRLFDIQRLLTELDMTIFLIVPSLIVRQRLAQRYHIAEELLDIQIIESSYQRLDGSIGTLELFALQQNAPGITEALRETERTYEYENHIAFVPYDPHTFQEVVETFTASGFEYDGGGINPVENAHTTVTYLSHRIQRRRIELQTYQFDRQTSFVKPTLPLRREKKG